MKPSLTEDKRNPPSPAARGDPAARLEQINRTFGETTRALEKVEMLCRARALPGLRKSVGQLHLKLGAYLEATASGPAMRSETTAQMLRALVKRLEEEIDDQVFENICNCAVDLGDELASHHRACVRSWSA